jgi:ADP-ribose pyrophosphatase YjhB (NUDIX family)
MIVVGCSVIVEQNNKILMVKETKDEAAGKLGLPGGQLEHNESLMDCAAREFMEETGYTAEQLQLTSITHKPLTKTKNSVVRFVYRAKLGELNQKDPELSCSWETIDQIKKYAKENKIRGDDVVDLITSSTRSLTVSTY